MRLKRALGLKRGFSIAQDESRSEFHEDEYDKMNGLKSEEVSCHSDHQFSPKIGCDNETSLSLYCCPFSSSRRRRRSSVSAPDQSWDVESSTLLP